MRKLHQIFENHYNIVMISNVVKRSKYSIARSATLNADDVYTRNLRSVTYKTVISVNVLFFDTHLF